jgi:hypothetical protein
MEKIAAIVDATLRGKPEGMTHWSCRTMAMSEGVSKSAISNIWRAHNLQRTAKGTPFINVQRHGRQCAETDPPGGTRSFILPAPVRRGFGSAAAKKGMVLKVRDPNILRVAVRIAG